MFLLMAYQKFRSVIAQRYRPERHYMRGPGPKWRERHPGEAMPQTVRPKTGRRLPRRLETGE